MAPPHQQPPALTDDVIMDILLRLPPEDFASLARASLVCKAWRRLLSDRAFFLCRYREIHGAPPFVGFLYNDFTTGGSNTPASSPFSPRASAAGSPTCCRTLDCRHGRVLLHHRGYMSRSCLTVWDPISGLQRSISVPVANPSLAAAVLCASSNGGCDHIDCSDEHYLVVLLTKTSKHNLAGVGVRVRLYSSVTRKWSECAFAPAAADLDGSFRGAGVTPSLLAGDTLFFHCDLEGPGRILKYNLTRDLLSVIWVPVYPIQNMILCTAGDGGLGVAVVEGSKLRLLSGRTGHDGMMRWVRERDIQLDSTTIPIGVGGASTKFCVVGFVRANDSIFSVEVKSGRISKIGSWKFGPIFPLTGFYIPGTS